MVNGPDRNKPQTNIQNLWLNSVASPFLLKIVYLTMLSAEDSLLCLLSTEDSQHLED